MERRLAVHIGGDIGVSKEEFAFAVTAGIAGGVHKELHMVHGVANAVERAGDRHRVDTGEGGDEHGEILQIIRARIGIARVVGRHAVAFQVDAQAGVGENRIAQDRVAGGVESDDRDAVRSVSGDEVAVARGNPSNRVVERFAAAIAGDAVDEHTRQTVAQELVSGDIGSDAVSLDDIEIGVDILGADVDAVGISGDHVQDSSGRASDGVVIGPHKHAVAGIAKDVRARGVGANQITLHVVVVAEKINPIETVVRNDVAGAGTGSANGVGESIHGDAVERIAQGFGARDIGPDEVSLNQASADAA